jgi:DNA-directed RNA polymerase specialized sigma subunit
LKQIGARLGISYVRVTQIEKEVLRKIKKTNFSKNDTIYSIE